MTFALETALDHAHDAMLRSGESEPSRRAFFAAVAAAELVLVLEEEVADAAENIRPVTVETEAGEVVLAFDTDARMAQFLGAGTPVATLSGRQLAQMLAPARLGLALNLEVAPSAILLPAEVMAWLAEMAPAQTQARSDRIVRVRPPENPSQLLLDVLDARLAMLAGQGERAYLAQAEFADGSAGLVLGITGVPEPARPAVGQAIAEALSLAGLSEATLDVLFPEAGTPIVAQLSAKGFGYDLPAAPETGVLRVAPGSDPEKPPKLV